MAGMAMRLLALVLAWTSLVEAEWEADLPRRMLSVVEFAQGHPQVFFREINASPLQAVAPEVLAPKRRLSGKAVMPTVVAHGMGDSCYHPGMRSIARGIGSRTGTYATCIPTGNVIMDTVNGFLMTMKENVDVFAARVRADPKLAGGFNAMGFSQGNSIIRGYIQRYNNPPVNSWVSVHGTVMGVAAFPSCFRQGQALGLICRSLAEALGELAYNPIVQGTLFQANYFRDPSRAATKAYLRNSEIAVLNNEDPEHVNASYAINFAKTKRFAMVKAAHDLMVYPNEGEWWGSMADGAFRKVLPMRETKFYKEDLFGLRTADEAGKISFESTEGGHLDFTHEELYGWVDKYFIDMAESEPTNAYLQSRRRALYDWVYTYVVRLAEPSTQAMFI